LKVTCLWLYFEHRFYLALLKHYLRRLKRDYVILAKHRRQYWSDLAKVNLDHCYEVCLVLIIVHSDMNVEFNIVYWFTGVNPHLIRVHIWLCEHLALVFQILCCDGQCGVIWVAHLMNLSCLVPDGEHVL
jgi:hypothetical protein